MKRAAIIRWTGRGKLSDLEGSIDRMVRAGGVKASVSSVGGTVVVSGPEPLGVAARLQHLPGVSWIAAGRATASMRELTEAAGALAKSYLKRGDRFSVEAEGTRGVLASDVGGAVTSKVLEAVRGARVSEDPKVRLRAAVDGRKGAVGVEVTRGPGGVPTGDGSVSCLVSGGIHSSVVAWSALLAGYRVRLVHVSSGEESLLAVARLYAELSNRADPRGLSLKVLEGGQAPDVIADIKSEGEVFGGFHAGRGPPPRRLGRAVSSPLFLLSEEAFAEEFESLGIRPFDKSTDWTSRGAGKYAARSFSGGPADVSAVVDGLA